MDYKNLFDFFRKVETTYPVQQWTVAGIHIWPLVRIQMGAVFLAGMQNAFSPVHEYTSFVSNNWWNYIKSVQKPLVDELKLFYLDFKHRENLAPCDVVMLGDAGDRNVQMPTGELMDHNLDPIYDALQTEGYRIFKFEEINPNGPRYPRWTRSYITNGMMLWAKIRRKWNKGTIKDIRIDADLYQSIMQAFSRLQPNNKPISLEYVIYNAIYVRFLADEFQEKLKIMNPRLVVLECWYSINKMALSVAAHKLGIPVVDVQHGAIGENYAYYDWRNMPLCGFEVMPDYIWVWSQDDYALIARWGEEKVVPILGGRSMYLVWGNPDNKWSQFYYDKYKQCFDLGRPTILFTLQWGAQYPDWIIDFINESNEYIWLIRLHPAVDESQRAFLRRMDRKDNIIWEDVGAFPLEILLQKVSLHITMYSAVAIEGEKGHCFSIVIHPLACQLFAQQIQKGLVRYAGNREDLSVAIYESLLKRSVESNNGGRIQEIYSQGKNGVRRLINVMKMHNPYSLQ